MKITMIGTGYVGLVTGACFAEVGNDVLCLDVDAEKIRILNDGGIPIFEPGLKEMVARNRAAGRIRFTTDVAAAVAHGEIQVIAVGTPPDEDGSADLKYVTAAARDIGRHMTAPKVVVDKSTVPVGTADRVKDAIAAELAARSTTIEFSVVSNPEFLKEGAAVDDFMKPDRVVIGASDDRARAAMRTLYAPFQRNHERMIFMDIRSAELTKYAANAMLATRISFMNEIANLAECLGADVELVRQGIGSDPRIGYHFLYAGCGYGGSCFPKDVQALQRTALEHGHCSARPARRACLSGYSMRSKPSTKTRSGFSRPRSSSVSAQTCPACVSRSGGLHSNPTPTICVRRRRANLSWTCWAEAPPLPYMTRWRCTRQGGFSPMTTASVMPTTRCTRSRARKRW